MGAGNEPASAGPPDRQTLRLLERILTDEPLIVATEFEPSSHEPQLLRALLDVEQYPSTVEATRLDVRWFTTGDFSIHYVETMDTDEPWECRWDRHPNPHNARVHFHQPPTAEEVEDLALSSVHPLDVVSTVLAAVERRIARQWSTNTS